MAHDGGYRRLPGRPVLSVVGTASLWLGPDHLLSVRTLPFTEEYKHFYFRDVQALVVRTTDGRTGWAVGLGVVALLCALLLFAFPGGAAFWGSLAVLFALAFLTNWALGPTCTVHVCTAVQQEQLRSLRRLRTARRALGKVRAAVEEVQGHLSSDQLRSRFTARPDPNPGARTLGRDP